MSGCPHDAQPPRSCTPKPSTAGCGCVRWPVPGPRRHPASPDTPYMYSTHHWPCLPLSGAGRRNVRGWPAAQTRGMDGYGGKRGGWTTSWVTQHNTRAGKGLSAPRVAQLHNQEPVRATRRVVVTTARPLQRGVRHHSPRRLVCLRVSTTPAGHYSRPARAQQQAAGEWDVPKDPERQTTPKKPMNSKPFTYKRTHKQ